MLGLLINSKFRRKQFNPKMYITDNMCDIGLDLILFFFLTKIST